MQLAGELAKMNLASLIRLVRNSELTGKICLSRGESHAFIFVRKGQPIHAEAAIGKGREALLELFLWETGTFSYEECAVQGVPVSLSLSEPLEKVLKDGTVYHDAVRYLEGLKVGARTVFKSTDPSSTDAFLAKMDGKTSLGELVKTAGLTRSEYILRLQMLVASGKAQVVAVPAKSESIELPEWVRSRLKQDNPDVTQAIVDLVIWADRMKCWLYQADVDMQRVISSLDGSTSGSEESVFPAEEHQVPAEEHQVPAEEHQVPVGVQQVPIGVQQVPIGVQQVPVGVQQVPVGLQQAPVGVQQAPVGVQQAPADCSKHRLKSSKRWLKSLCGSRLRL